MNFLFALLIFLQQAPPAPAAPEFLLRVVVANSYHDKFADPEEAYETDAVVELHKLTVQVRGDVVDNMVMSDGTLIPINAPRSLKIKDEVVWTGKTNDKGISLIKKLEPGVYMILCATKRGEVGRSDPIVWQPDSEPHSLMIKTVNIVDLKK